MSNVLEWLFPAAIQPAESTVERFAAKLASRVEGAYFQAEFTVWSRGATASAGQERRALIRRRLVCEAQALTERVSVALLDTAEIDINARLPRLSWTPPTEISAQVQLSAAPEDQKAAADWENLRARIALARMNAKLELERLRHLREEIFQCPEVARTYWLDRHPDAISDALSDNFERIAEKLGSGPGPQTLTIANLLREFLTDLPPEQKETLLDLLRRAFVGNARPDLAERLPAEPA